MKFKSILKAFASQNQYVCDLVLVIGVIIQSIYFHLSPRKTSINPLNLAQMQKPMAVSESAGPDGSEAPPTF